MQIRGIGVSNKHTPEREREEIDRQRDIEAKKADTEKQYQFRHTDKERQKQTERG